MNTIVVTSRTDYRAVTSRRIGDRSVVASTCYVARLIAPSGRELFFTRDHASRVAAEDDARAIAGRVGLAFHVERCAQLVRVLGGRLSAFPLRAWEQASGLTDPSWCDVGFPSKDSPPGSWKGWSAKCAVVS